MPEKPLIPFKAKPPQVEPGQPVWCRTAFDTWIEKVARSTARYDRANGVHAVWLSVAVSSPEAWRLEGDRTDWVNWPAEDVSVEAP